MKIKKAQEKQIALHKAKELEIQTFKNENLSIKNVGYLGAKTASEQVDGGEELRNAAMAEYMLAKPIVSAAQKGTTGIKKQFQKDKEQRNKDADKKDKSKRRDDEKSSRNDSKDSKKSSDKSSSKQDGKKPSGKSSDDGKGAKGKKKKIGLIQKAKMVLLQNNLLKTQGKENGDNQEIPSIVSSVAPWLGLMGSGLLVVSAVVVPVMAVIAIIYNSPFAIFMPPLESGDTVMSVTSAYVSEFNSEINSLATEHIGYDTGEIVYVDYEGTGPGISNYYDIIGVYMVKHGVGDTATIINDTTRAWIKQVFDDMCAYSLTSGTEIITDDDGNTETKSVLYVNVVLKNFNQMKEIYNFDENQVELLELVMGSGNFTLSGYVGGGAELSSKLTNAEINDIMEHIADVNQQFVCRYALNRVGYPYSQAYRDSGNYYDCSSLAYYSWKAANVNISYGGATTAAAEAQGLEEAGKTVSYESMQPGDLIFYSYCRNGRYKNISHVAIYIGNGKVVEAKSEQYGVVYGDIPSPANIVLIGRPQ